MTTDHGPDCYACTDPAGAAAQITEQRTEIKEKRARARVHRQWADWAKTRYLRADPSTAEFALIQSLMEHHYGAANALAGGANFDAAQLDRVEVAHPKVARHSALDVEAGP